MEECLLIIFIFAIFNITLITIHSSTLVLSLSSFNSLFTVCILHSVNTTESTVSLLEKGQYHVYKLRTVPTDYDSPVYELTIPFLIAVPQKSGLSSEGA